MIEYYIDGSTKEHTIGVGIVRVNEFGFIEKHHFKNEHINPTSNIAEGFALEKTFDLLKENDIHKHEIINIYTDSLKIFQTLMYNENTEFTRGNFFVKQESNSYLQHLRSLYIALISRNAQYPLYYCDKTKAPRPLIKIFFKDQAVDKKYLQEAHSLSRTYIKEEPVPIKVEFKAVKENTKWVIVKNNKDVVAENKRPIIALSDALKKTDAHTKQIKLCPQLETILKNTMKNKLSNDSMKSAIKTIEDYKSLINH